jgi:hypothetical protein
MADDRPDLIQSAAKVQAYARQRLKEGVAQRDGSDVILAPDDVAGAYDAARVLLTTLGGQVRPITRDDLLAFQASAQQLGKRFKGGITAKQVIDLSMPIARQRTQRQIHTAFPVTAKGGRILFQTNAGPDSKHRHHTVTVEFLNFDACVASPVAAKSIVPQLLKGAIKIDCDCEDWRYRLRYMATKGKYAAGPWFETGFPKITNPLLHGVGCKHVLRVCVLITGSPTFKTHAIGLIDKARQSVERKVANVHVKNMKAFQDAARKESSRQRQVKTTGEKKAQRLAQPSYQRQLAARKKMREATAKKPVAQKRVPDAKFIQMLMQGGFSQAAAQSALAAAKAAQ